METFELILNIAQIALSVVTIVLIVMMMKNNKEAGNE